MCYYPDNITEQMFDFPIKLIKKYFKKAIDKSKKKIIMKPQFKNPTEKGVVLLRHRLYAENRRCREPTFGYKTFQRLRYFFVAVAEVFFYYKKTKKEDDLV